MILWSEHFVYPQRYIQTEPTGRTIQTVSIISLPQGKEPRFFKRMFPAWDDDYWQVSGPKFV